MSGVIERLQDMPTPPGLFTWNEAGLPVVETAPGTRGIRVEERTTDEMFVLLADLPGIDPAEDVDISVSGAVLTLRVERDEGSTETGRPTGFRYGTVVHSALPAGARHGEAVVEYKNSVLTIMVPVPVPVSVPEPEPDTRIRTVRRNTLNSRRADGTSTAGSIGATRRG
ncbi:Hsp20/alpha crystallin family protein [Streptomyces ipomoeae]|uniref:Hsp20/alpha crystallin family protein n=1 Tax=Streptomyces ipomoeae TaxID=103232 RepID=UPI0029A88295|nr:Hsp20/alpha crystallin family protein [Streptomyces ipomoeae]MDX2826556.1 Hsp20/alpha crystallin family protein [Streptomyces ipomoeae]MDX2879226.1 Hsp20/alpha crystallin family protein [Streptomyces ipomoeae]